MAHFLQSGETGTLLPDGEVVLRLMKASKDGRALEVHFALTSREDTPPYSISVWAESLTSPEQAREFMGENQLAYGIYCRLSVRRIRTLTTEDFIEPVLDVVWDTLYNEETGQVDIRPGAIGHSGLTGLRRPPDMERRIYKTLRTRLADIANEDLRTYD